ncbi:type VI secretion system baseplate subunit TssG [Niveispirillum irakense]|uniref:type VI secretion system baseplate subunit TssG n=1 Tax=Niveispirillum irakense TaxID=34011 RepID=UPI00040A0A02|nr:type VI secretion system baseplate subunit TssG [Niveispirillum irakense]
MAGPGWRAKRSLIRQLLADPGRFEALQAVRLLELDAARKAARTGTRPFQPPAWGNDAGLEAVRFRSSLGVVLPGGQVQEIREQAAPSGRVRYTVRQSLLGLAGSFGPLPQPIAELVSERARAGDFAMRDFLDLFNHRLVSILMRSRRAHRPELAGAAPWDTNLSAFAAALCGIGTPALKSRLDVPDRALYRFAGLLNRRPASQHGVERLLECHFNLPVRIHPLQGNWMALEPEDHTRLGRQADSTRLGRGAVLGTRAWDQGAGILVELGPLNLRQYLSFQPGKRGLRELMALVAFHAGPDLEVTLRLRLRGDQVPKLHLKHASGRALGRTTLLGGRKPETEMVVTVRPGRERQ